MANTTTITGNLTREPEIRYTREGQATAQLGVAVNRRWQDRTTQEWQESTSFFDVICWRDLAENVALSLTKGMRVVVTGRLEHRTWETEEGEHRSKVEITADEVGAEPALRHGRRPQGGAAGDGVAGGRRDRRGQRGRRVGRGGLSAALADHHDRMAGPDDARRRCDGAVSWSTRSSSGVRRRARLRLPLRWSGVGGPASTPVAARPDRRPAGSQGRAPRGGLRRGGGTGRGRPEAQAPAAPSTPSTPSAPSTSALPAASLSGA